jgi:hypothetical protein
MSIWIPLSAICSWPMQGFQKRNAYPKFGHLGSPVLHVAVKQGTVETVDGCSTISAIDGNGHIDTQRLPLPLFRGMRRVHDQHTMLYPPVARL